ncbi:MAG: beta-ketoacyl-ACP synthase II [Candidatus Anammoxibacter sp.]
MSDRRVVVTGLNALTSLEFEKDKFWNALCNGKSGIKKITGFDTTGLGVHIGGEIQGLDYDRWFDKKEVRRLDRFVLFAMISASLAIEDSGIDFDKTDRKKVGTVVGSGIGGIIELEKQCKILLERGPSRVSPFLVPKLMVNAAPAQIAIKYGLYGPNFAVVTACASGANAIGDAYRLIRHGDADVVIAGGSEAAVTPLAMSGFCNMKALSANTGDMAKVSRPFDKDRDGFVIAEGAGIVVLEELEHAKKRKANNIYAEVLGYGLSADAYHVASPEPSGRGAADAITNALRDAKINRDQVDYINAHATSTPLGDAIETRAIKKIFGDNAKNIPVGSTKSMLGHLLGAAGGVETAICALIIQNGVIPPTMNYDNPDPECEDLDFVPNVAREKDVKIAMSNSFGFGGHNVSLILGKHEN